MSETLRQKYDRLTRDGDQNYLNACGEIEELEQLIKKEAHEEGMKRSPKFAAMNENQRSYCHFMGLDPDEPDLPCD